MRAHIRWDDVVVGNSFKSLENRLKSEIEHLNNINKHLENMIKQQQDKTDNK